MCKGRPPLVAFQITALLSSPFPTDNNGAHPTWILQTVSATNCRHRFSPCINLGCTRCSLCSFGISHLGANCRVFAEEKWIRRSVNLSGVLGIVGHGMSYERGLSLSIVWRLGLVFWSLWGYMHLSSSAFANYPSTYCIGVWENFEILESRCVISLCYKLDFWIPDVRCEDVVMLGRQVIGILGGERRSCCCCCCCRHRRRPWCRGARNVTEKKWAQQSVRSKKNWANRTSESCYWTDGSLSRSRFSMKGSSESILIFLQAHKLTEWTRLWLIELIGHLFGPPVHFLEVDICFSRMSGGSSEIVLAFVQAHRAFWHLLNVQEQARSYGVRTSWWLLRTAANLLEIIELIKLICHMCGPPVHFLVAMYSLVSEREFRKCSGIIISSQRHSTLAQLALTISWLWRQDFLVTFAHCRKPGLAGPPSSSNGSSL